MLRGVFHIPAPPQRDEDVLRWSGDLTKALRDELRSITRDGVLDMQTLSLGSSGSLLTFFGGTPASRSAVSDPAALSTTETADGTYSSNEQDMLGHIKSDLTALRTTVLALTNLMQRYNLG